MKSSRLARGCRRGADDGLHQPGRRRDGSRGGARVRRSRRPGQQGLDPAVDVRRLHRLRHRRGDDRADRGGVPAPERDGLSQRRAVHAQRPVPRSSIGRCWTSTGSRRRPATSTSAGPRSPADIEPDHRGQPDLGDQVLRLRLHADLPAGTSTRPRPSGSRTPSTWMSSARRRARPGQTLMVHNHDVEFEAVFGGRTVFDILMANTDPRNVVFQLDLYWAANGGGIGEPGRGARALRQPGPAVPREGHGGRDVPRADRDRRRRASSTSRRSSRRPRGRSGTTSSSTTRASAIRRSTRSRQPRRASTISTA